MLKVVKGKWASPDTFISRDWNTQGKMDSQRSVVLGVWEAGQFSYRLSWVKKLNIPTGSVSYSLRGKTIGMALPESLKLETHSFGHICSPDPEQVHV